METAKLKDRLAELCKEYHDLELEKKETMSEFNSQLRSKKKQVEAISDSIARNDPSFIINSEKFDEIDLKELLGPNYAMLGTIFEDKKHA